MNSNIEIIARGVINKNGKLLLCKIKGEDFYFFPGGHLEPGEKVEDALKREIKEEIGASLGKTKFIGIAENFFSQKGRNRHEVNIAFSSSLNKNGFRVLENYMEFEWVKIKDLDKTNVLPVQLKEAVSAWLKNKKIFWVD